MSLNELLLNSTTRTSITLAVQKMPQTILITGAEGTGKKSLAEALVAAVLGGESLENAPYALQISPDGNTFTIEQVRTIREFLKLKTTGSAKIRRVLLLLEAERMNNEAQNALLKTLEEPPADTVIILCVSNSKRLKATIRSRAQIISVLPISQDQAVEYFQAKDNTLAEINRAYMLSDGAVGLMAALLDGHEHPLLAVIDEAKIVCQKSTFERLLMVDSLSKNREQTTQLLDALQRIAKAGLRQAVDKSNAAAARRWLNQLGAIYESQSQLPHNPNLKLLLTDLFIRM